VCCDAVFFPFAWQISDLQVTENSLLRGALLNAASTARKAADRLGIGILQDESLDLVAKQNQTPGRASGELVNDICHE
jgi:hypothetical protein